MPKKRVLFVLPFFPYPLVSGGHQAIFNGIKILKNEVDVFIYYEENWDENNEIYYAQFIEQLGFNVTIYKYKKPPEKKEHVHLLKRQIKSLLKSFNRKKAETDSGDPYVYIRYKPWESVSDDRSELIKRIISENEIDIVQCEMLGTIGYVYKLPSNVKKIFVHHEIGFVKEEYIVKNECSNIEDYRERLNQSKKFEVEALNNYDLIITLSSIDAYKLVVAGVTKKVIPSFCIINHSICNSKVNQDPHILTFVGSGNHPPNVEGLRWFINNCWEKIIEKDNQYFLNVIGVWNKKSICDALSTSNNFFHRTRKKANYLNINFRGFVENLESVLNSSISIIPIFYGSGIRIKILESASAGSPIISTTMGAEGIPLVPYNGDNTNDASCIIADTSESFINGILLLKDDHLRTNIINNAMDMISNNYSEEKYKENRLPIYQ